MMQQASAPAEAAQVSPRVTRTLVLAVICGVLVWPIPARLIWERFVYREPLDLAGMLLVLPPVAAALPLTVALLLARRWSAAICVLALFPLAMLAQLLMIAAGSQWILQGNVGDSAFDVPLAAFAAISAAAWMALALTQYRRSMSINCAANNASIGKRLRKSLSLAEIFLLILILGIVGAYIAMPPQGPDITRARTEELVLAANSAKAALAEGMQTHHSWSAEWMSAITIAAAGKIASVSIGPTGQIIVYGTPDTSNSVVTMTPTVTTDGGLIWSCIGRPAKYMPASCR